MDVTLEFVLDRKSVFVNRWHWYWCFWWIFYTEGTFLNTCKQGIFNWRASSYPDVIQNYFLLKRMFDLFYNRDKCHEPGFLRGKILHTKATLFLSLSAALVGTWWYWVSMGRHWLVLCGAGSVWGGTGWYLVLQAESRNKHGPPYFTQAFHSTASFWKSVVIFWL